MRTLYGLRQSPWTEKARWALDHHGIEYTYVEHLPLLGELRLRMHGTKTVPLLVDDHGSFGSSLAIAKHADEIGTKEKLFDGDVEPWALLSDRMADVGRTRLMSRFPESRDAQLESVPSFLPKFLAPFSANLAVKMIGRKHNVRMDLEQEKERELIPALDKVREALKGGDHLVGGKFTFADIAIAAAMRAVKPEARAEIGPGLRSCWTDESLANDWAELIAWRDRIYAQYR